MGHWSFCGIQGYLLLLKSLIPAFFNIWNRWVIVSVLNYFLNWTLTSATQGLSVKNKYLLESLICRNLFSRSSVKNFVHWFQMIHHGRFSTYQISHAYNPRSFPTNQITCPMYIYYGSEDLVTDEDFFTSHLPNTPNVQLIQILVRHSSLTPGFWTP